MLLSLRENLNIDNKVNINYYNFVRCMRSIGYGDLSDYIIIFRIDYKLDKYNIPIIDYRIFIKTDESTGFINIQQSCNNSIIYYYVQIDIIEEDLYLYNQSSDYYTDECKS